MRIESYSFGKITINGKTFTSDVIIYPDRIDSSWWRKSGHLLQIDDLFDILKEEPKTLIIGTGYYDTMKVTEEVMNTLSKRKIKIDISNTKGAVALYNNTKKDKKVVGAFHLTC